MAKRPGVVVVCGNGIGKTNAAIGKGIKALAEEKTVTLIQFLKGKANQELMKVLKRLEPEMKAFSFEKYEGLFENLPENEKKTGCVIVDSERPAFFPYSLTKEYKLYKYDDNEYWGYKDYDTFNKKRIGYI